MMHSSSEAGSDEKDGTKGAVTIGEKLTGNEEKRSSTLESRAVVRRNTTADAKTKTEKKKKRKSMMTLPGRHYGFRRKESKLSQEDTTANQSASSEAAVAPIPVVTEATGQASASIPLSVNAVPCQEDIASFPIVEPPVSSRTPNITVSQPEMGQNRPADEESSQQEPIYDTVPSVLSPVTETPTKLLGADDDVDLLFAAWCKAMDVPVVEVRARRVGLAWLPPGLADTDIAEYISTMEAEEVPRLGSIGARRRQLSLLQQVPMSDISAASCQHLSPEDAPFFTEYVKARDSLALDTGIVRRLASSIDCHECQRPIPAGRLVVTASLLPSAAWHPDCFKCQCCAQPLADLIYCQLRDKLVCVKDYGGHLHDRCAGCSELIFSGEYVRGKELTWHRGCLQCQRCKISLDGNQFALKNGEIFCLKCFAEATSSTCLSCQKSILLNEKEMSYAGKHWHAECFHCYSCKETLEGKPFGLRNDHLLCAKCTAAPLPTILKCCNGCGQEIDKGDRYMESQLGQWHEECFVCCTCHEPLESRTFLPKEDQLYCSRCYEETFAARCHSCHGTITSVGVTYQGDTWHRQCFCCTNCGTGLAGQKFKSHEKRPYCGDCHRELFGRRCARCRKPLPTERGTKYSAFQDRCWHNECFTCSQCGMSLVGKGFLDLNGDVACPDCGRKNIEALSSHSKPTTPSSPSSQPSTSPADLPGSPLMTSEPPSDSSMVPSLTSTEP